jgi:hypothetical protein
VVLEVLDRHAARPPTVAPLINYGWLGNLRGVSGRGSVREVEDILLRGGRARGTAVRLAQREASASGVAK